MKDIKLYSFALSPFALKVRSYLLFLGVNFETIFVHPMDMRDPKDPGKLKDLSNMKEVIPCGQSVPALTINENCINESSDAGKWLSSLYPDSSLIPKSIEPLVLDTDNWVTHKLINLWFRDSAGFDDSLPTRIRKRWALSRALNKTTPNGVSIFFRVMHLFFMGRSFVSAHIAATDTSRTMSELRQELAQEFEERLCGGPFFCGSSSPTMADLSAYPQIVKPRVIDGMDYLLPGAVVANWVARMEKTVPNLHDCFPRQIQHSS